MSIFQQFRRLIRSDDVVPISNQIGATRKSLAESYRHLRSLGFAPKTVIDVGVADGTPDIYENFPSAYFLLVEPLQEFEDYMQSILRELEGEYVLAAAGAKPGVAKLNVHDGHMNGSSLYKESMGAEADGTERIVPVITLDSLVTDRALACPMMLKVDVQGAELDVLEGAINCLPIIDVVVLEVSMFQFMKGAPQFHDIITYMKNHGFVAYDIVLGWNRPLDNALGQVDIIFVHEHGKLRRDHSFSTLEQLSEVLPSPK